MHVTMYMKVMKNDGLIEKLSESLIADCNSIRKDKLLLTFVSIFIVKLSRQNQERQLLRENIRSSRNRVSS